METTTKKRLTYEQKFNQGETFYTAYSIDGYSYRAIGRFFGLDKKTVKRYIHIYLSHKIAPYGNKD